MIKAGREMHIRLSREQTHRLLVWAGSTLEAEVNADCEPSGYYLEIGVGAGYPHSIEAISGAGRLDLGDIHLDLVEVE
jgi:hypothetical protein